MARRDVHLPVCPGAQRIFHTLLFASSAAALRRDDEKDRHDAYMPACADAYAALGVCQAISPPALHVGAMSDRVVRKTRPIVDTSTGALRWQISRDRGQRQRYLDGLHCGGMQCPWRRNGMLAGQGTQRPASSFAGAFESLHGVAVTPGTIFAPQLRWLRPARGS
jgi:hypothetical protein